MRLKKDDNVLVTTGKDKGRKGKISKVFRDAGMVIIEGINIRKKHQKPRRQGQKGEVVSVALPIDVSNVKLVCPKCTKATRVGYRMAGENKYRACKECGEAI